MISCELGTMSTILMTPRPFQLVVCTVCAHLFRRDALGNGGGVPVSVDVPPGSLVDPLAREAEEDLACAQQEIV